MSDALLSQNEYDIIFAGGLLIELIDSRFSLAHCIAQGGTTACITAGRLAKADPSLRILVLEAGPHTKDKIEHITPGRFYTHLAPGSNTTSFHVSKPSDAVGGRSIVVHTARCVGGGSSVNWLMYNRPAASDYDDWETEHGNPGWGSKEIIPLLRAVCLIQLHLYYTYSLPTRPNVIKSTLIFQLTDILAHLKSPWEVTTIMQLKNFSSLVPR